MRCDLQIGNARRKCAVGQAVRQMLALGGEELAEDFGAGAGLRPRSTSSSSTMPADGDEALAVDLADAGDVELRLARHVR